MTYKVSLIIPAWNAENTISECIISAIRSKKGPSEIIVVDDFSNDNTVSVVNNLCKELSNNKTYKVKK